jgi:transglutaminase-like putative cysteine protease
MVKRMHTLWGFLFILLSLSFYYDLNNEYVFAIDSVQNEDEIKSRYTYNITYSLIIKPSATGDLKLWWIVPKNNSYQRINFLEYSEHVIEYIQDEHNNTFAVFNISFNQNDMVDLKMSFVVDSFYDVHLSGSNVEKIYDLTDPLYSKYTSSHEFIQANETKIIEKSNELTRNIQDPIEKAKIINQWVYDNLEWTGYESKLRGALWALETSEGDCSEFAALFVSLCRSTGIPSRLINGIAGTNLKSGGMFSYTDIGHDWAEIYLSDIGWVWVDPTYGWFDGNDGIHIYFKSDLESVVGPYYRYKWYGTDVDVHETFSISPFRMILEPEPVPEPEPEPEPEPSPSPEPETEPDRSDGIPGFPYLAITLGLVIVFLLRYRTHY